jgi:hypothetical protein
MPTEHIIGILISERDKLSRAIEALQGPIKRRGRPPKNPDASIAAIAAPVEHKRKRRTPAQRRAQSEKMKKYWAAKRKQQKGKE